MRYAIGILALVVVLAMVAFVPPTPEPTVVAGAVSTSPVNPDMILVTRFWSDGLVDISKIQDRIGRCDIQNICGPPEVAVSIP